MTYEPRTEAISPAINDDVIATEDSNSKSTKDEQTLLVEKLKKVEAEIVQTDLQITRLRRQKEQLEQAASNIEENDEDQENVCDTKQLSIAKLVYHENRAKAQKAHSKLDAILGGNLSDLPVYNQPSDNAMYHTNATRFADSFKTKLIGYFKDRLKARSRLEISISEEYDRRMEKWLKRIESEDSEPSKRVKDAKAREFFEKQFPELKKARESGERFSRVGQRVARSDAEFDEILDGITEREDQDKKVKSYAVIPPMLEEMRSRKPNYINKNGYVEDIIAEYKQNQIQNTWTTTDRDLFKEYYLQHPKNFGAISSLMSGRKTVACCVKYYYMSKKVENYKLLLKRQQKRRTRSFVKPTAAAAAAAAASSSSSTSTTTTTAANQPASNNDCKNDENSTNDTAKSNGLNKDDKPSSGNDNVSTNTEQNPSTDQTENSKTNAGLGDSSASMGSEIHVPMEIETISPSKENKSSTQENNNCCICDCEFSETNLSRNVTRSNYQLYGISADSLKPGLKICYSCRFRHVRHPSFDEPLPSPDPVPMVVDEKIDQDDEKKEINSNKINSSDPPIPVRTTQTSQETRLAYQRTSVRDIIHQAIEMSFKPRPPESPIEPIQPKPMHINHIVTQQAAPIWPSCNVQLPYQPIAPPRPQIQLQPYPYQIDLTPRQVVHRQPQPPIAQHTALNLCRKPPVAHAAPQQPGGLVENGVLNLSKRTTAPMSVPLPVTVTKFRIPPPQGPEPALNPAPLAALPLPPLVPAALAPLPPPAATLARIPTLVASQPPPAVTQPPPQAVLAPQPIPPALVASQPQPPPSTVVAQPPPPAVLAPTSAPSASLTLPVTIAAQAQAQASAPPTVANAAPVPPTPKAALASTPALPPLTMAPPVAEKPPAPPPAPPMASKPPTVAPKALAAPATPEALAPTPSDPEVLAAPAAPIAPVPQQALSAETAAAPETKLEPESVPVPEAASAKATDMETEAGAESGAATTAATTSIQLDRESSQSPVSGSPTSPSRMVIDETADCSHSGSGD